VEEEGTPQAKSNNKNEQERSAELEEPVSHNKREYSVAAPLRYSNAALTTSVKGPLRLSRDEPIYYRLFSSIVLMGYAHDILLTLRSAMSTIQKGHNDVQEDELARVWSSLCGTAAGGLQ
jgi:hypothetical protein